MIGVLGLMGCLFGGGDDTTEAVDLTATTTTGSSTSYETPEGTLDESTFLAEYAELYCSWWDTCMYGDPCLESLADAKITCEDVVFDESAAYTCVYGIWRCQEELAPNPLPTGPDACNDVYTCPTPYM